jgi:hypothetical protein
MGSDTPGLILGEPLRGTPTNGLLREVEIGQRLLVGVGDDEALAVLVDRPGRPEAARSGAPHSARLGR